MPSIVAIGGATTRGEYLQNGETRPMDSAALRRTGAEAPNVLFLPTARGDPREYVERFDSYFHGTLGCRTDALELTANPASESEIRQKVAWADAVYVGGGATSFMLDTWRTLGVDALLREAWEAGTVMFGISAGALCWTDGGLQRGIPLDGVEYGPVAGLGLVDEFALTVHATPTVRSRFCEYLRARDANGVALENNAAIEVTDGEWRVVTSTPNAFAYHVRTTADGYAVSALPEDDEYRPLSALQ